MKRIAPLLLLLFSAWLLSLPGSRLHQLQAQVRAQVAAVEPGKIGPSVDHVAAEPGMPRVAPAAVRARLPVALPLPLPQCASAQRAPVLRPPDLRQALRRVLTRRRVPRLSSGDPPWR